MISFIEILIIAIGFGFTGITILALNSQIKKQATVSSTQICLSFFERLRNDDFRNISKKIRLKEKFDLTEEHSDWISLMTYLNHFEHIAIAEDREAIDLNSTMSFFNGYLKQMRKNDQVHDHICNQKGANLSYLLEH